MVLLRNAAAGDYPAFARLFDVLETGDPPYLRERFEREIMPNATVATLDGNVVGYVYFAQFGESSLHVRHLAVAAEHRRCGLGRQLLEHAHEQARAQGARTARLNVRDDNPAARALYESVGYIYLHSSVIVRLPWSRLPPADPTHSAEPIEPPADASIEHSFALLDGTLQDARTRGRVLKVIKETAGAEPLAACVFDPTFPGCPVFRVRAPDRAACATALLHAIHAYAGDQPWVQLVTEGDPELAAWLEHIGAKVHLRVDLMQASLAPAARTFR